MIMSTGDLKRVHFAPPLICVHHKRLAAPSRAGARIERNERERENGSVRDEDRERGAAPNGERVDAEVARPREHVSEEEERERPRTGSGGEARRRARAALHFDEAQREHNEQRDGEDPRAVREVREAPRGALNVLAGAPRDERAGKEGSEQLSFRAARGALRAGARAIDALSNARADPVEREEANRAAETFPVLRHERGAAIFTQYRSGEPPVREQRLVCER